MGAISGWGGRVRVNTAGQGIDTGTAMSVTRWTVNDRAEGVDATTMEHNGFPDYVSSVNEYDISFDCIYDTTLNPMLPTPNLNPGVSGGATAATPVYVTITLTMDRAFSTTKSWIFSRVLVTDMQMDDEVRGVVRYSVQGKATRGLVYSAGGVPTTVAGLGLVSNSFQLPSANPG